MQGRQVWDGDVSAAEGCGCKKKKKNQRRSGRGRRREEEEESVVGWASVRTGEGKLKRKERRMEGLGSDQKEN